MISIRDADPKARVSGIGSCAVGFSIIVFFIEGFPFVSDSFNCWRSLMVGVETPPWKTLF